MELQKIDDLILRKHQHQVDGIQLLIYIYMHVYFAILSSEKDDRRYNVSDKKNCTNFIEIVSFLYTFLSFYLFIFVFSILSFNCLYLVILMIVSIPCTLRQFPVPPLSFMNCYRITLMIFMENQSN